MAVVVVVEEKRGVSTPTLTLKVHSMAAVDHFEAVSSRGPDSDPSLGDRITCVSGCQTIHHNALLISHPVPAANTFTSGSHTLQHRPIQWLASPQDRGHQHMGRVL